MTGLPTSDPWFSARRLDDRITLINEPHVHPIFSANIHLVEGAEADLLIDSGMGVAPLRPFVEGLRRDPGKPLICLTTHCHVDHFGGVQEFDTRLVHPIEAEEMASPSPFTLFARDIGAATRQKFLDVGYGALTPLLIDALPRADYDPASYVLQGAPATGLVEDGEVIGLGDWHAEVLHLPGHSPGQVGLWHAPSGTLFGADAIYDGPLIWSAEPEAITAYAETLQRLRALPVTVVHGGHDPAFGQARMIEICDSYLALWQEHGLI